MASKLTIKPLPHQTDGVTIGELAADKAGFHGAAVAQRAGAAQAAVSAAALGGAAGANPTQAEYGTMITRLNAALVLVDEMRTVLIGKGLMKGSA